MSARIAASLVGRGEDDLRAELAEAGRVRPDVLEWRADCFEGLDRENCADILGMIQSRLRDIPLLFTLRDVSEGGLCVLPIPERVTLYASALATGTLACVDVETAQAELMHAVRPLARKQGVNVLLSRHDLRGTPSTAEMLRCLADACASGADLVKLVVTAHTDADVTALVGAVRRFRRDHASVPLCAMALGASGRITRMSAEAMGCNLVFASLLTPAAPGQLPVTELRRAMAVLAEES